MQGSFAQSGLSRCIFLLLLLSALVPGVDALALPSGFSSNLHTYIDNSIVAMEFAPDGRLFVVERNGRVRIVQNGQPLSQPFHTFNVNQDVERGLLGVAIDPNYSTNRWIYFFYVSSGIENVLARVRARANNQNISEPGSEQILLRFPAGQYGNHIGGAIHFGIDGMLYVGIGDHGTYYGSDAPERTDNLYGKILRLNVSAYPNIIPTDNPYVGQPGARGEIWAIGHRNPFSFNIDPADGRVYINDVGDGIEKVYHVTRGAHSGWPGCFDGAERWVPSCNQSYHNPPIHTYNHSDGSVSITGGTFYRAGNFPSQYNGVYFFSDWGSGWIKYITRGGSVQNFAGNGEFGTFGPLDLDVGPDGAMYLLHSQGGIHRIVYNGGGTGNRPPSAVMSANPNSGAAPLVTSFSASGSSDPDGDPISFRWDFGDGSPVASGINVSHTYDTPGTYTTRLTVTDSRGASANATRSISVSADLPPSLRIVTPTAGSTYRGGDTINFNGEIIDPETGPLPPDAYEWEIIFGHDQHFHPFFGPQTGLTGGSVTIPNGGHNSTNVWYRFILRLRPQYGTVAPVIRDIRPELSQFTVTTVPPGLSYSVDGRPHNSTQVFEGIVNNLRTLSTDARQTLNGEEYEFVSWSDGGAREHQIASPEFPTTFTARFRVVDPGNPPPNSPNQRSCAAYNTHHQPKIVIAETVNTSEFLLDPVAAQAFNSSAQPISQKLYYSLAPGGQFDVLVPSALHVQDNQYGLVCAEYESVRPNDVDARGVSYKISPDGRRVQYAFAAELNPQTGRQYLFYNTYNPSLGVGRNYPVENWLEVSLARLPESGETLGSQAGTLSFYDRNGNPVMHHNAAGEWAEKRQRINLTIGGKVDVDAHSVGPARDGLVVWEPDRPDIAFDVRIVRYVHDGPNILEPSFTTAFQVPGMQSSNQQLAVPYDTFGKFAWLELASGLQGASNIEIVVYTMAGAAIDKNDPDVGHLIRQCTAALSPRQMRPCPIHEIAPNAAGVVTVRGTNLMGILMEYAVAADGLSLRYMYGLTAQPAKTQVVNGSYNVYIGQSSEIWLANLDNQPTLNLSIKRSDGVSVLNGAELHIQENGLGVLSVGEILNSRGLPSTDNYGSVTVQADQGFQAWIIRRRGSEYAMPIELK